MFCKNCGKQISDVLNFCPDCGAKFNGIKNEAKEKVLQVDNKKSNWNRNKTIKTVATILVVSILLIIKFGYLLYSSAENSTVETNNKALENYNSGNSDQAITQFQEASQSAISNDNKINSLKNLAYVYATEGKKELALSSFKEALALTNKESFDYYLISGEIDLLDNKPNAALADYKMAYQINPENYQINNALNLFYLDLEDLYPQSSDYVKALVYAKKAYDLDKSEISKQNLAIAYYFNSNYGQTISLLSTSDATNAPYVNYWLGLAYVGKEDPVNAKIYLQKTVDSGLEVPKEITDYLNLN